eukprot:TRINITY_DN32451_c0_g5_i1.p1 TRINITY_DN32451_c0_g5~~TRINITY_DN32451_c0_g5_i1.p1  ORF type:complete len:750 (-),score=179.74 TRINITY_DN32451_c0_g5_i1:153-2402(-)
MHHPPAPAQCSKSRGMVSFGGLAKAPERLAAYGQYWGQSAARCYSFERDFLDEDQTLRLAPVPGGFMCPISGDVMENPVVTVDGCVYDRAHIEAWFRQRAQNDLAITSPCTGLELPSTTLMPLVALQKAIEMYMTHRPELRAMCMGSRSAEEAAEMLQSELLEKQALNTSIEDEICRLQVQLEEANSSNTALRLQLEWAEQRILDLGGSLSGGASSSSAAPAFPPCHKDAADVSVDNGHSTAESSATSSRAFLEASSGSSAANGEKPVPVQDQQRRESDDVPQHRSQMPYRVPALRQPYTLGGNVIMVAVLVVSLVWLLSRRARDGDFANCLLNGTACSQQDSARGESKEEVLGEAGQLLTKAAIWNGKSDGVRKERSTSGYWDDEMQALVSVSERREGAAAAPPAKFSNDDVSPFRSIRVNLNGDKLDWLHVVHSILESYDASDVYAQGRLQNWLLQTDVILLLSQCRSDYDIDVRAIADKVFDLLVDVLSSDIGIRAVVNFGTIEPLAQLLKTGPAPAKLRVMFAMKTLAKGNTNVIINVVRAGAVPPLVSLLQSESGQGRMEAAYFLGDLLRDADELTVAKIMTFMPMKSLVNCLLDWALDVQMAAAYALAAVRGLRHLLAVAEAGAIERLVSLLESQLLDMQLHALKALANLAAVDEIVPKIVRAGAIPFLVTLLGAPSTEARLYATGALVNLVGAQSMSTGALVVQAGAVEALHVVVHDVDHMVSATAEKLLRMLDAENCLGAS